MAQNSTAQSKVSKEPAGSGEKVVSSGSSEKLIGVALCEKTTVMFAKNSTFVEKEKNKPTNILDIIYRLHFSAQVPSSYCVAFFNFGHPQTQHSDTSLDSRIANFRNSALNIPLLLAQVEE